MASSAVAMTLVHGESPNPTATFTQAMAARMVTVGSGPNAHWKVRAQGVEPVHAELYWDGAALWARNGGSVSGTYINNQRADDWVQVFDGTEMVMGRARVLAKVSGPAARNPAGTDPRIAAASAGYIGEEESTMVFSNAKGLMAAAASVPPPAPAPTPAAGNRGRAGTMAPPMPASSPMAMAPQPDPPSPKGTSEATVIRASPYAALLEGQGSSGPLPAAGNRVSTSGGPHTIAPGAGPSVVVSQSAVSLPVEAPARVGTMAPPVSASLQAVQPMAPPTGMSNPGLSNPGLSSSQPAAFDDPFGPMDIPPPANAGAAEKTVAGTSPRTLVLAGITLVIGLIAAILPPPQQQQPGARAAHNGPLTEVQTRGAAPPRSNNVLNLPISPPGLVGVIVLPAMATTDAQGNPRPLPPPNPQDPIRLATEAVVANRFQDAAVLYERLAREHPEAPLFAHFAVVLRQRVALLNCPPGATGCIPSTAQPTPAPAP